ncbi:MAG: sigma-70 family RNA polymerase sigma factor [Planctomycetota bacterium]
MHTTRVSLLQRIASKSDSLAWARFVEIYTPLVHHWISRLGLKDPDQSDLVQEVFLVLLGKISTFRYESGLSFRGWLRTVTLNKCRDLIRRKKRQTEPVLMERLELAEQDETALLTEAEYRRYVVMAAMKIMKKHFSETTWRACWEHVAMGRSAKEVAEELEVSPNSVYLARGRVLNRLRQELAGLWE